MTRPRRRPAARPPVRHDSPRPGGGLPGRAARTVGAAPRDGLDHFTELLLGVLSGQRPVHSMLRHTVGRAYDELAWLAEHGPLRTTRGTRPVVRAIGYCEPRPGVIEAFVRVGAGDRLCAMAFRLEHGSGSRWRCAAVELGGPRMPHADDD
ncbi:Rv3235 family protein [Streptomyces sp. CRN 30]|uniref:Rv3235 family protein n=1 Tax=Streptomyces sp. CRN 30 TaxID=3075613 RepID=UPI002A8118D3|nr:Rv3235 family protein [Streptomyces sp. CRN 30]